MFPRGRNRRIAAHAALPDGIGDAGLSRMGLGNCEVGKEEQVKKGVGQLFRERLCVFKLIRGSFGRCILGAVKEYLIRN